MILQEAHQVLEHVHMLARLCDEASRPV